MKIVIIQKAENTNMPVIETLLKNNSDFLRIDNAWLIKSHTDYRDLFNTLTPFLGKGGIIIIRVNSSDLDYMSHLTPEYNKWLRDCVG